MISSIFDSDADTSDSEDVDYVPSKGEADLSEESDDELVCSDEDAEENNRRGKPSKKRKVGQKCSKIGASSEKAGNIVDCSTKDATKEKAKAEDVWKSFLEEVNNETKNENNPHISSSDDIVSQSENLEIGKEEVEIHKEDKCSKYFEFAGETLAVKDDNVINLGATSVSSKLPVVANPKPPDSITNNLKRKGGLDSVMGTILNKKKKLNTLEKTLMDWRSYKKDEGLEDEIEHFNKGKGGFLERQRFLERSDLRSFEIEKATRLSKIKKP